MKYVEFLLALDLLAKYYPKYHSHELLLLADDIWKWINNELRERIHSDLSDRRTLERGYFKGSYIEILLAEHSAGRRDHSHALWLLWMLELWHRRFVDA